MNNEHYGSKHQEEGSISFLEKARAIDLEIVCVGVYLLHADRAKSSHPMHTANDKMISVNMDLIEV